MPEINFEAMQKEFPHVQFCKVNTVRSPDIRDKYADSSGKPYYKFYRGVSQIDDVSFETELAS